MFEPKFIAKVFDEVDFREMCIYGNNNEVARAYPNDYTEINYADFPVMYICCIDVRLSYISKILGNICADQDEIIDSIIKKKFKNLNNKEARVTYYMKNKLRNHFEDYFAGDVRLEVTEENDFNIWFE